MLAIAKRVAARGRPSPQFEVAPAKRRLRTRKASPKKRKFSRRTESRWRRVHSASIPKRCLSQVGVYGRLGFCPLNKRRVPQPVLDDRNLGEL
jgi:hypothetical protein